MKSETTQYLPGKTDYHRAVPTMRVVNERLKQFRQPQNGFENKLAQACVGRKIHSICGLVKPLTAEQAYEGLPKDTSPGFPLNRIFRTKKEARGAALLKVASITKQLEFKKVEHIKIEPCQAAVRRTLCRKGEDKTRLVWAYPMAMSIIEAQFGIPLMEELQKTGLFGWSVQWLNGAASDVHTAVNGGSEYDVRFGADWSNYDARVQRKSIEWAFSILTSLIDWRSTTKRMRKLFALVQDYFIYTPIILGDKIYRKSQGVPSGSYFTQIIDSLVNMYYHVDLLNCLISQKQYNWDKLFVYANFLGDDSMVVARVPFLSEYPQIMAELALSRHNAVLNPKKTWFILNTVEMLDPEYEQNFQYLGKTIRSPHDVLVDTQKLLGQILMPEKKDKSPSDTLMRLIGLKWSVGTDVKAHILLDSYHKCLTRQHGSNLLPSTWSREVVQWLALVSRELPALTYPQTLAVRRRYAPTL